AIAGDAQNLQAFLVKIGVGLLHARQLLTAGAAPGGPKIDEDDLALPIGGGKLAAVDRRALERQRLAVEAAKLAGGRNSRGHLLRRRALEISENDLLGPLAQLVVGRGFFSEHR